MERVCWPPLHRAACPTGLAPLLHLPPSHARSTSRRIDSQSSEAGGYDPACPGRLRGGQILFPLVFRKVETRPFPAVANPCLGKGKASRKLA